MLIWYLFLFVQSLAIKNIQNIQNNQKLKNNQKSEIIENSHHSNIIQKRDESLQPVITLDFPHLLGLERVKAWADKSLDPCQDFFKYSCNGFINRYQSFAKNVDVLSLMSQSNTLLMKMVMDQDKNHLAKSPVEKDIFYKTKDYYSSCTRSDIIEKRGFEPIIPLATSITSKFSSGKPIASILGEIQAETGVGLMFNAKFGYISHQNIDDLKLQIIPSPAYKVEKDTIKTVMNDYVENGILPKDSNIDLISEKVYEMEKRHLFFAKHLLHSRTEEAPKPHDTSKITMETGINFSEYLSPLKLNKNNQIHFWSESEKWISELAHLKDTDPQDLKNYGLWRLAATHYNKLSSKYFGVWKDKIGTQSLSMHIRDVDAATLSLQKDCMLETGMNLKYLAGNLYAQYAFNSTQKDTAVSMVDNLFGVLKSRFENLEWMDKETKTAAIKKLDNLVRVVGVPKWVQDPLQVAEYYRPLKFKPDSYFENSLQASIYADTMPSISHSRNNNLGRDGIFAQHMWLLNAMHLVDLVQIQINPSFLQRPLFSDQNLPVMNYASLGGVIGHEMTHAFDSLGSQFDSQGQRKPWMTERSQANFKKNEQCFIDQYSNLQVKVGTEMKSVNGELTITENLADNGGMHLAYQAWKKSETSDPNSKPNDSPWTLEQIFWISYAQTNCDISSSQKTEFQLQKDVHSPKPVRVNGAIMNSPEFAKAFQCSVGSPMHPRPESQMCRMI
ncbi:hypothetical protein BC833DRAFT_337038 [Globomyces pollinis-pini]|nr:hypothetical protein BC833DRAFT_337038 [Globomyces pollinis-pini]